jgi:hypothetical protein
VRPARIQFKISSLMIAVALAAGLLAASLYPIALVFVFGLNHFGSTADRLIQPQADYRFTQRISLDRNPLPRNHRR